MKVITYEKILFPLILMLVSGFSSKFKKIENNFLITGQIRGVSSDWIYLGRTDTLGKIYRIDSAKIQNSKFKFYGELTTPEFARIGLKVIDAQGKRTGIAFKGEFILDKGNLTLNCHKDSLKTLEAFGTKGQDEYMVFSNKAFPVLKTMQKLMLEKQAASRENNKVNAENLQKKYDDSYKILTSIIVEHVGKYPASIISAFIAKTFSYFPEQKSLSKIYALLSPSVKKSAYGNQLFTALGSTTRVSIGKYAPLIRMSNTNNKLTSLGDYKGKYVLIDFWASWCGPCRQEFPNLISLYKDYSNKGFEIVGVSMDDNRNNWVNAIKEDHLPWVNISDLKASKSEVNQLYGLKLIPTNFLLDKDGKIIAKNLFGEQLSRKLHELMP